MGPLRPRSGAQPRRGPQMAEWTCFEPPIRVKPYNGLANRRLQPLGHHSILTLAEGVGFEPTELSLSGFQDRRLKPLGHPSAKIAESQAVADHSGAESAGQVRLTRATLLPFLLPSSIRPGLSMLPNGSHPHSSRGTESSPQE